MKISKIYISAFGGLKDFTLDLTDGLNVIYGNNEDGKSTIAAFIKTMFYGTGRNTKNLAESLRMKYTPWDGSTMGGRIFFEHEGKKYCLEREFRKSDSTDRISLTDLDSGKTVDTSESVGQQFFGMSQAAFERSLFIGSGDFIKDDTAAGEINGKLSNIAFTGSEDVSYKEITKNIFDTRAKLISKSGRSGSYNEDLQALESLNTRLQKADADAKSQAQLNAIASEKRTEYELIYKKCGEFKSIIGREQDIKNREKLAEFLQTKQELDAINASLTLADGTIINENFAQKIDFCLRKYEKCVERCDQIRGDIAHIKETIELQNSASPESTKEEIEALKAEVATLTQQKAEYDANESQLITAIGNLKQNLEVVQNKKSTVNPIFLILAVVLAAGGGALAFFVSPIAAAITLCIAAVLLTLAFIIKPSNANGIAALQNELNEANNKLSESKMAKSLVSEQINNVNARINTLSSILQADTTIKQQRLCDLNEKTELLSAEQEKADTSKTELLSLLSELDGTTDIDDAKTKLDTLKEKTEKQKMLKLQLKTASQFLGNIDYDDAKQKLDALSQGDNVENFDFESVKAEYDITIEKLSNLKDELTAIATELKTSFKNSENPEELKREIIILEEKINSKKAFCDAADLAIGVLEESFYELRRGYGSELEQATHNIFANLTDGRYKSVSVTDTLDLSVEKSNVFGTRELDYLSLGTTHQAYLSLRLAIASLIGGDTPLPIFLDDSLSQYDDTRTKKAINFLKDFCQNGQGILFTCHKSVCDYAESSGIQIKYPYK